MTIINYLQQSIYFVFNLAFSFSVFNQGFRIESSGDRKSDHEKVPNVFKREEVFLPEGIRIYDPGEKTL